MSIFYQAFELNRQFDKQREMNINKFNSEKLKKKKSLKMCKVLRTNLIILRRSKGGRKKERPSHLSIFNITELRSKVKTEYILIQDVYHDIRERPDRLPRPNI